MESRGAVERPCYSARVLQPFVEVLAHRSDLAPILASLRTLDPDYRMPVESAHRLLQAATEITGDVDLGLKAARAVALGDGGPVDYLVGSMDTVRGALEVAARYMRLINDALDVEIAHADSARVRFTNRLTMPRAAIDYQVGAFYRNHLRHWPELESASLQVLLPYAKPESILEHTLTFAPAPVRFGAPFAGFEFDAAFLATRLGRADGRLHSVLIKHAERTLRDLPPAETVTEKVRDAIAAELAAGANPSAPRIAKILGMSTSTLARRLESEGTQFKLLADELRMRLAKTYLVEGSLGVSEVALLLGFSQSSAFHRAFRRWTGQTPMEFRDTWRR